jgi:hypothetical protein
LGGGDDAGVEVFALIVEEVMSYAKKTWEHKDTDLGNLQIED